MARPRGIGDVERQVLLRVALERRAMPSDKKLAQRFNVSVRTIQREIREFWRSRANTRFGVSSDDSTTESGGMIAADEQRISIAQESIPARPIGKPRRQTEERAQPFAAEVPRSAR